MKRLALLLLLLPALAGAKTPDENDLLDRTLDSSSPFYYPNLMMRYNAGDSTLTAEDYHYLYYGYAYQEAYKPLEVNPDLDRVYTTVAILDPELPQREHLERLVSAGTDALRRDPFNPRVLNLMAFAYGALGDGESELAYYRKLKAVLATIEASGDGLTQRTPMHILMFDHALDVLSSHDLAYGKSRVVSREVEYVPLMVPRQTDDGKIRGYYFDYSRIYRNKPDNYVFKRHRTWQFNNLKPREYK